MRVAEIERTAAILSDASSIKPMWLVPFFCEFNLSGILGFFVARDLLDEALPRKRPFGQPAGPASGGRSFLV